MAKKAMNRIDVINKLIEARNYTRYLEIGVEEGLCFKAVRAAYKAGVDPAPDSPATYKMTSDEFFATMNASEKASGERILYDIIFVDGLHTDQQATRDISNALAHLTPGGVVIVHDCNPPTKEHASVTGPGVRSNTGRWLWSGTVYRAFVRLNLRSELDFLCVDCDWGVGIVWNKAHEPPLTPLIQDIRFPVIRDRVQGAVSQWKLFKMNHKTLLRLITYAEFERRLLRCGS